MGRMDQQRPRGDGDDLRRKAEDHLRASERRAAGAVSEADARSLIHELQVPQIELEMQNAELHRAQAAIEEASEKYRDLFDFAPVGYFLWDFEGRILEVNLAGAALVGLDRKAVIHKRFGQFVAMENRPAFADFCKRVLTTDTQQTCECQLELLRGDGQPVYVLVEGLAVHGDSTSVVGQPLPDHQGPRVCRAAVINISQQKRADKLAAANQALMQAKTAAEAANAAKSQFLANMSHELRTPMNAILGMIDVALPKMMEPIVQDCLQTAKVSADILLALLNDLLDSAKIESGKLELESAPFSLRRMLDQITRVLAVRASENGLCFYCRMPEEMPDAVVGDRMRLQQVLLNLAGNAIKFTEHGEVEVSVRALEGLGIGDWGSGEPATADPANPIPNPQFPIPSVTLESASCPRARSVSSSPSPKPMLPWRGVSEARASDSLSARASWRCWAGASGSKARWAREARSASPSACLWRTNSHPTSRFLSLSPQWPAPNCASCWRKTTPQTRSWLPTSCRSGAISWKSRGTAGRPST